MIWAKEETLPRDEIEKIQLERLKETVSYIYERVEPVSYTHLYLSRDDFRQRTKASKTVIDYMGTLGLLGDLPESNQLSLFDL